MRLSIGRSVDDQDVYRNKARSYLQGTKFLPNGNVEEEFKIGRRHQCRVFFEIDKTANKITGWRYEGTKQDCVIVP
jgi:hypothetical protein